MKIAIDVSPLNNLNRSRGVGIYTKELIAALNKYENNHEYLYFQKIKDIPFDCDIVHIPYFDPFIISAPKFLRQPRVTTVHDLTPLIFPDKFPSGIRGKIKWNIEKQLLKLSSRIITDSFSSKKDIELLTGYSGDKIDVVYPAPKEVFFQKPTNMEMCLKKYSINGPYFIYVGDVNWNKNILGLLNGFADLIYQKKIITDKLVLTGFAFLDESLTEVKEINALIKKLRIDDYVKFIGQVSEEELVILYNKSIAAVIPSFYEGFGFPVLEAMASGTIVITADNSSLAEIKGPAITIDANKYHTISTALVLVSNLNESKRNEIINKGKDWLINFSWRQTARQTVNTYEKIKHSNTGL
jgi:glycosyltransferase involved in cell wall biosynthesis